MNVIADWLRTARVGQAMPSGEPWTQDYFLDRLKAETGWSLLRSNYSRYENGKSTPKGATLKRFVTFWSRYGVPAPDLAPKPPVVALDPTQALLERQALAMERQAAALELIASRLNVVAEQQVASGDALAKILGDLPGQIGAALARTPGASGGAGAPPASEANGIPRQ